MSDIKQKFGTTNQAITITLASLTSSSTAGRESTVVDNSSNLFRDVMVMVKAKIAAGAPANDKALYVYVYGTVDTSGPTYPDAITGSDAAITFNVPLHLKPLGVLVFNSASDTRKGGPWSVAAAFGGRVPEKWGIAVQNFSGQTLTAPAGDHSAIYQGVLDQV